MNPITKYLMIMMSLLLLSISLVACGGTEETTLPAGEVAPAEEPSAQEILAKMEETVNTLDKFHFTAQFQIATQKGGVRGTIELWREQPDNLRIEFTSDTAELSDVVMGRNASQGWVYSPHQSTFYVTAEYPGSPHLHDQPEVHSALSVIGIMRDRGLNDTNVSNLGTEQVNGHDTYKVQVTYPEAENSELSMEGITMFFWIDQETFLPHKLELDIERGETTGSGIITRQGDIITDESFDQALFTFEPPADTVVVDMTQEMGDFTFSEEPPSLIPPEAENEPGSEQGSQ